MRRKPYSRIFCAAHALLAGAFLLLLQFTLPSAAAQEPQPPPPPPAASPVTAPEPQPQSPPVATQDLPPPAPDATQDLLLPLPLVKSKKVWTIDDLETSRSPMDHYLLDKEASEAAAAAQDAADALASQQASLRMKMPSTVAETQHAIDDTLQDMNDQNDAIDRLNKEFQSAPNEQKAGIQREMDRHTTGVQTLQQELKALQDHLKQLNRKSPNENSADSGKLPPG